MYSRLSSQQFFKFPFLRFKLKRVVARGTLTNDNSFQHLAVVYTALFLKRSVLGLGHSNSFLPCALVSKFLWFLRWWTSLANQGVTTKLGSFMDVTNLLISTTTSFSNFCCGCLFPIRDGLQPWWWLYLFKSIPMFGQFLGWDRYPLYRPISSWQGYRNFIE